MELGGNAPLIVFDDADLDTAVEGAMVAKMRNMGEACTAANRIFVHSSVADEFASRLAARMSALTVGPGTEPGTNVGPLIDAAGRDKVDRLVRDAVERGAKVLTGGELPGGEGYFYPPTVLVRVPRDAGLTGTEIFGPVAALFTFDDEDEVVRAANDTEWGLVSYLFTRDLDRALRVGERLETGMVGLNTGLVSNPAAPFGGVKQSGIGREGAGSASTSSWSTSTWRSRRRDSDGGDGPAGSQSRSSARNAVSSASNTRAAGASSRTGSGRPELRTRSTAARSAAGSSVAATWPHAEYSRRPAASVHSTRSVARTTSSSPNLPRGAAWRHGPETPGRPVPQGLPGDPLLQRPARARRAEVREGPLQGCGQLRPRLGVGHEQALLAGRRGARGIRVRREQRLGRHVVQQVVQLGGRLASLPYDAHAHARRRPAACRARRRGRDAKASTAGRPGRPRRRRKRSGPPHRSASAAARPVRTGTSRRADRAAPRRAAARTCRGPVS